MNAANRNQVVIRPDKMIVVGKEEAGIHAPQKPYNWFQRLMLQVMGTLTAKQLI
jgi:hypothetical protein